MSAPKLLLAAKREALRNGPEAPTLEDAKQAAKTERQRSKFQTMVATKRVKRLAAWDAAMGKVSSVRVMLCRFERLPPR